MDCPKCGFAMSDLDAECPRCKRQGPPASAPAPSANAGLAHSSLPPTAPGAPAGKSQFPFGTTAPHVDTNNSGTGMPPPLEVCQMGWCWGAFGLSWIWGIGNRVWLSFLCMVPYAGPIFGIWLAIAGHKLAWQNRRFDSFQQYRDTMRVWNNWGLAIFLISLLPVVAGVFLPVFSGARGKAVQSSCIANEKQIMLAMMAYCQDWDEVLPPSSIWQEAIMDYVKSDQVLLCPSGGGYEYNKNLNTFPLLKIRQANKTGALYEVDEADEEWYPHKDGMNVGFVDGHCRWATEEEVKAMVW